MDNQTEANDVITIQYEQPTAGEVAQQALVAAGITLVVTALAYGALYATAAGIGAVRNGIEKRRAKKEAKEQTLAESEAE